MCSKHWCNAVLGWSELPSVAGRLPETVTREDTVTLSSLPPLTAASTSRLDLAATYRPGPCHLPSHCQLLFSCFLIMPNDIWVPRLFAWGQSGCEEDLVCLAMLPRQPPLDDGSAGCTSLPPHSPVPGELLTPRFNCSAPKHDRVCWKVVLPMSC